MDENTQVSLYRKWQVLSHFFFVSLCIGLLHWVGLQKCLAQTPYPEVHFEAFHRVIWEDGDYRLLHVKLSYGDTSAFHLHDTPIFYINTNACEMYLEDLEGGKTVELPARWIGHDLWQSDYTLVHRIAPRCEAGLNLFAFQAKSQVAIDTTSSQRAEAVYSKNGFEVIEYESNSGEIIHPSSYPVMLVRGSCESEQGDILAGTAIMEHQVKLKKCSENAVLYWVKLPKP